MDRERVLFSARPAASEKPRWPARCCAGRTYCVSPPTIPLFGHDEVQHYHFWPQFRAFLVREYTEGRRKALFSRGG